MNDRFSLVREHELRALIEALDSACEVLDDCGFRDAGDSVLGLALRDCHQVKHALQRAADYLDELR